MSDLKKPKALYVVMAVLWRLAVCFGLLTAGWVHAGQIALPLGTAYSMLHDCDEIGNLDKVSVAGAAAAVNSADHSEQDCCKGMSCALSCVGTYSVLPGLPALAGIKTNVFYVTRDVAAQTIYISPALVPIIKPPIG